MNGCGAAIYFANEPKRSCSAILPMARGQAEALVPHVRDVVDSAGIEFSAIDMIVTTRGPGTFTGLRVGLSAARSFALALDVPLFGMSTFEVMARGYLDKADHKGALGVIIESRRSDYYFQLFDDRCSALCDASALEVDEILRSLQGHSGVIIGDAQTRFLSACGDIPPSGFCFEGGESEQPDPLILARVGAGEFGGGDYTDTRPLYLRGADISLPKSLPRQLEE
jgi:tRNA threonylcarbamoyladenosine biosynthesis protein TsaB